MSQFRLQTVPPDQATGQMAEVYGLFQEGIPVPAPLVMMSASPRVAALQAEWVKYFREHPTLSFKLLTLIRFLSACEEEFSFCVAFNGKFLKSMGLSDVDLDNIQSDPATAPLEEKEKALLVFAVKALKTPEAVQDGDIPPLRALGWSDSDIFDALAHGAGMIGPSRLFRALAKP